MYQAQTLVFAHRGASAYAPMNTLPAFELAVQQGADGIELDVHQTRDAQVIVMHNDSVDDTTNGHGAVANLTLAEIKALDAGEWFNPIFKGTPVPTLDEVFATVGAKLIINVEIKFFGTNTNGIEQLVADKISHFGLKQRVIVSSFNPLVLINFRQIMPDVPLGYLFTQDLPTWPIMTLRKLTYEATHPHEDIISAEYMQNAKAKQYRVNVWTVNDPVRAAELAQLGVDGIICDNPDVIRKAIRG